MVINRYILMGERWRSGLSAPIDRAGEANIRRLTFLKDQAGLV